MKEQPSHWDIKIEQEADAVLFEAPEIIDYMEEFEVYDFDPNLIVEEE